MKAFSQINYIGDNRYLKKQYVTEVTKKILPIYWKHNMKLPGKYILDINVFDDKRIRALNKKFLGRDKVTDVIAFSLIEGKAIPEGKLPLLGQIVISKETAIRQAKHLKHTIKKEMTILLIHGILHISGWQEGEEIRLCQEKIYNSL
ncbi:rRNA maturation RNase YbeY [Elusimicrobiota bacterium]